ncbi:NUDIX hydrolase [Erythrobacter sp.]|jgi:8-oxo-dGTP pyrophosphatase MutT (NUDIX family)|uniref:NUDIX hydrolase n=1 Tax=Erythrobacter sp. TaxID=1042 RepID=UPI002EBD5067|nr:NUDIX domain-containing protein [Erythrobacter sp.]
MNGLRLRRSARIIVLCPAGDVLLFRFAIPGRPPFWVTPGGECESGETFEEAARRELAEETGIEADCGAQIARTTPRFVTPEGEPVQADERYFLLRVADRHISTEAHTPLERKVMTRHRWFGHKDLVSWNEAVYPESLAAMVAAATVAKGLPQ